MTFRVSSDIYPLMFLCNILYWFGFFCYVCLWQEGRCLVSVPRSFGLSRMLVAECLPVCSEQCVVVEAEEVV